MEALGEITVAERAEAGVKDRLARFLMAEGELVKLIDHSSSSIRTKASMLYSRHKQLDARMVEVLGRAGEEQEKGLSLTSFTAGAATVKFGWDMEQHMKKVNNLVNEAGGFQTAAMFGLGPNELMLGAAVAGLVLFAMYARK